MALHVNVALHIEGFKDVLQNLVKVVVEHCRGRSATDVKGCHRLVANQLSIDIDLFPNSICVAFCYLGVIKLFVVRTVRADLATKRNMKVKAELVYIPKPALE